MFITISMNYIEEIDLLPSIIFAIMVSKLIIVLLRNILLFLGNWQLAPKICSLTFTGLGEDNQLYLFFILITDQTYFLYIFVDFYTYSNAVQESNNYFLRD